MEESPCLGPSMETTPKMRIGVNMHSTQDVAPFPSAGLDERHLDSQAGSESCDRALRIEREKKQQALRARGVGETRERAGWGRVALRGLFQAISA